LNPIHEPCDTTSQLHGRDVNSRQLRAAFELPPSGQNRFVSRTSHAKLRSQALKIDFMWIIGQVQGVRNAENSQRNT
jgi:hypothetical protein